MPPLSIKPVNPHSRLQNNPDFWPSDGKNYVGQFKTYFDCHGFEPQFYVGMQKCKPYTPASSCKDGYVDLPSEFKISTQEKKCLEKSVYNPNRDAVLQKQPQKVDARR